MQDASQIKHWYGKCEEPWRRKRMSITPPPPSLDELTLRPLCLERLVPMPRAPPALRRPFVRRPCPSPPLFFVVPVPRRPYPKPPLILATLVLAVLFPAARRRPPPPPPAGERRASVEAGDTSRSDVGLTRRFNSGECAASRACGSQPAGGLKVSDLRGAPWYVSPSWPHPLSPHPHPVPARLFPGNGPSIQTRPPMGGRAGVARPLHVTALKSLGIP